MRVVIRRTGLSPDLLRAWEKRYRVVAPPRSEGGQRLYSDADVERLALLRRATSLGRNIGQIAELDLDALGRLVRADEEAQGVPPGGMAPDASPATGQYLVAALRAVEQFDARALEDTLRLAAISLPVAVLMELVIGPLLSQVGARWHQGTLRASHEHLASVSARRILHWIASESAPQHGAPGIVVTTPAGQVHEIGALLAAATAATEGWRVTYLGPDLPAEDIAAAAAQTGARIIALSVIFPLDEPTVHEQLRLLRRLVDPTVHIVVGGGGADSYRATLDRLGLRTVDTLTDLRTLLRATAPPGLAA
jgi:DNA-binding transcriptional MerR regulator/methylmalonyl-CoA mutase cobalamin-binding subunit